MSTIFISYRRDDSAGTCGRIYERLAVHFGRDAVFKDVDDIPYGVRFPDYLAERLRSCRIELVVIGKYWLTLTDADGTRRLDAPGDFVRTEVETGLRDGLIVVPVLVDNASMPHAEALPESIRELVEYHAAPVRYDPDFETDMQRLIRQLERWLGVTSSPTPARPSAGRPLATTSSVPLTPTPSTDPQAAIIAQFLPSLRAAAASRDWHLVLDKGDYLTSAVSTASVPAEVWRLIGKACYEVGDFARAAASLKSALGLVDAPTERLEPLRDYTAALIELKQWDELLHRVEEGSRLAPDDVFWPRTRLRALTEQHRARLARSIFGETEGGTKEIMTALDAVKRLAGPDDPAIEQARLVFFPPPIAPEYFPERLASLGLVPRKGKDPKTGKDVAFIVPPTVPVSAGSYQMGTQPSNDPEAQYDGPARTATTSAFEIARYPVTVAEYACFVRAGQQEPPGWQDQVRQKLDHPVVAVSWHDAVAYAAWLAGETREPWRLPTEEEWEKAARWDPHTGRSLVYPWGDTFDGTRCNTRESHIDTTTPVGTYGAAGASPRGAEDMAGNVGEWTDSRYDNSTEYRVLRGGCWQSPAMGARAAYRSALRPDFFSVIDGFRLAVSPGRAGS